MTLAADPGLTMFVYTAEPGSKTKKHLVCSPAGRRRSTSPNQ